MPLPTSNPRWSRRSWKPRFFADRPLARPPAGPLLFRHVRSARLLQHAFHEALARIEVVAPHPRAAAPPLLGLTVRKNASLGIDIPVVERYPATRAERF